MNQRRHPRLDINHPAIVRHSNKVFSGYRILNFSEGGLYLVPGDPSLLEQLGYGYHPVDDRPQITIELEGFRQTVSVAVVFVNRVGVGVTFVTPEKELFQYLLHYKQTIPDDQETPAATVLQTIPATSAILDRLQTKALDYLKPQYARFPVVANEDLIAATNDCKRSSQQADLIFTINTLERQHAQIKHDFFAGVENGFSKLVEVKPDTAVKHQSSRRELELVDKQEFDEWILLNGVAHRFESSLADQTFNLNLALSRLLQRSITSETNPLSPTSLLTRFKASLGAHKIAEGPKRIVYQAFGKALFGDIHRLYGEILACLEAEGIETDAAGKLFPSTTAPGANQVANPPHPTSALEHLSSLMDLRNAGVTTDAGSPNQYPAAARGQLIDTIDVMPVRGGMSILRQLEEYLRHEVGKPLSLDPLTRAAIGTSEELVVEIKQDDLLCSSMQALVDRLQVPFIKETINDPDMLENADHPGRRFLQAIEDLVPYCGTDEQKGRTGREFTRDLERLFKGIEHGAITHIAQVTQKLEELQDQHKELFERNRKLAIESFKRNEKLQQACRLVKTTLREMLLGESVSLALDRLFQYGWANLLIHTSMLREQESLEWKAYLRVVDILHKLFRADKIFAPLSHKHTADLLMIVRKGFAEYPVHPEGTEGFILELQHALNDSDAAQSFIHTRIDINEAYLNRLFVGQVSIDLEEAAVPHADAQWRERVAGLKLGEWLLLHRAEGKSRLVNLAWKNQQSDRYLLVDGNGIKTMEADGHYLARQFAANVLAIPEDRQLRAVDRAMQRILGKIYQSIEQQVSYDELTGLMNRRAFERLLNELLGGDNESAATHVLIMLDVDQFGLVNDLCGFEGGDKLLQSITNILHNYLPSDAKYARTGDDEFAILLGESSLDQGFQIAETQRQTIDEYRYSWANRMVPVTASLGVVEFRGKQRTSGELLSAASSACSIAKQAGRNCTRVYREEDKAFVEHKRLIKSVASIEDALERDRFVLVSQSIEPLREGATSIPL